MNIRTKILVILAILLLLIIHKAFDFSFVKDENSTSRNDISYSPTPMLTITDLATGTKEIAYIKQKLKDTHVPAYYTTCVRYVTSETQTFYQVEIHELHNGNNCPGATEVSPLAAMFRINKADNNITYYDVVNDKFIPFDEWVAQLNSSKN